MNYLKMKDEQLIPVVVELNTLLANYHVYYQKLRSCHWNILGQNFFDLHTKFEELYTDARIKIDEIAERVLTLKHHPLNKLCDYLEISEIQEKSPLQSDRDMVLEILNDHRILLNQMSIVIDKAENASDEGTVDLIGAYIRQMEKSSWMLNAWTKETNENLKNSTVNS